MSRVLSGTRIAMVFFFQPRINFKLLVYVWGRKPEQCPDCYRLFGLRKDLYRHQRECCLKAIAFDRFKLGKFYVEEDKAD